RLVEREDQRQEGGGQPSVPPRRHPPLPVSLVAGDVRAQRRGGHGGGELVDLPRVLRPRPALRPHRHLPRRTRRGTGPAHPPSIGPTTDNGSGRRRTPGNDRGPAIRRWPGPTSHGADDRARTGDLNLGKV